MRSIGWSSKVTPKDLDVGGDPVTRRSSLESAASVRPARVWYLLYEGNPVRSCWQVILGVLLLYTGTIFPYRLCFVTFQIGGTMEVGMEWYVLDWIESVLWWIDLVIHFFFTYSELGCEVDDPCLICKRYLCGFFPINLIACIPEVLIEQVVFSLGVGESRNAAPMNKFARMVRLQRLTRLVRLFRLNDFDRSFANKKRMEAWKWIFRARSVRIANFIFGLIWVVHMLSCLWYLCAALHGNVEDTWVLRRSIDSNGRELVREEPLVQWAHSMYFVLTVFTTIGFGDMNAETTAETICVCVIMIFGTIVHSVLVGEMLNVITSIDAEHAEIIKRREALDGFAKHAAFEDDAALRCELRDWVNARYQHCKLEIEFDREVMRDMLMDSSFLRIPQALVERLPDHLWGGRLVNNRFIMTCSRRLKKMPSRLPLLIALASNAMVFNKGEIVYQIHEHAMNVFFVMSGVFAHVGRPSEEGGEDDGPIQDGMENELAGALGILMKKSKPVHRMNSAANLFLRKKKGEPKLLQSHLHPYALLPHSSTFGALEVTDSLGRLTTVRCEENGVALALHKRDLARIVEEFPYFHQFLIEEAQRSDFKRRNMLKLLVRDGNYKDLAARQIQQVWRLKRRPDRLRASAEASDAARRGREASAWSEQAAPGEAMRHLRRELHDGLARLRSDLREDIRREIRGSLASGGSGNDEFQPRGRRLFSSGLSPPAELQPPGVAS